MSEQQEVKVDSTKKEKNPKQTFIELMGAVPAVYEDFQHWSHLQEREIIINDDVNQSVMDRATLHILNFNKEDKGIPVEQRKPIRIYIQSYGGSVYDGYGLIGAITASKTPVETFCTGYVMSMGLGIYVAGHKRYTLPYTRFMYHEIMSAVEGKAEEINRVTQESKKLQKFYDDLIVARTKLTMQKLNTVKKKTQDLYLSAEEAQEYGIVDEIVTPEFFA
jgi:ATP-dependent Clp protease protease subunit